MVSRKPPRERPAAEEQADRTARLPKAGHKMAGRRAVRQSAHDTGQFDRDPEFAYVGFRAPIDLKQRLEIAAAHAGRSLSTEVQFRLERSFHSQEAFAEALQLIFAISYGEDFPAERIVEWLKLRFAETGEASKRAGEAANHLKKARAAAEAGNYDEAFRHSDDAEDAMRAADRALTPAKVLLRPMGKKAPRR